MSILQELRSLAPGQRALTPNEAKVTAERQARRFRTLLGYDGEPMLPNDALMTLPRIKVMIAVSMMHAGMSGWDQDSRQYQVVINGQDHPARQRFTLAHEYKHIVDYNSHADHFQSFSSYSAHDQAEDVCDYFAACLLMPRHLLKSAWCDGIQNTRDLAQLFGVSKAAMRVRLRQTGTVPNGRHDLFTRETPIQIDSLQSITLPEFEVV